MQIVVHLGPAVVSEVVTSMGPQLVGDLVRKHASGRLTSLRLPLTSSPLSCQHDAHACMPANLGSNQPVSFASPAQKRFGRRHSWPKQHEDSPPSDPCSACTLSQYVVDVHFLKRVCVHAGEGVGP